MTWTIKEKRIWHIHKNVNYSVTDWNTTFYKEKKIYFSKYLVFLSIQIEECRRSRPDFVYLLQFVWELFSSSRCNFCLTIYLWFMSFFFKFICVIFSGFFNWFMHFKTCWKITIALNHNRTGAHSLLLLFINIFFR